MAFNANGFELGIRNLDALVANFYAADLAAQEAIRAEVTAGAEDTQALTILLCPKDTNFMAEHVAITYTPSGLGFEVGWLAEDFFNAGLSFYPIFQEFGTSHMAAQPSLGPAWDTVRPDFHARIGAVCAEALARTIAGAS